MPGHCAAPVQLTLDGGMRQRLVVVSHKPAPPQSASVLQLPGLHTPAAWQVAPGMTEEQVESMPMMQLCTHCN
jgi:hypothetical protein